MRRMQLMTAATLAGCAATSAQTMAAQTGFNGIITFTSYEGGGKQSTFVQTSKGRKVRLDGFAGDQGAMIIDGDAKVMMIVEPKKKQYVTMTEEDMKQAAALTAPMAEKMKSMNKTETDPGKYHFSNTGETELVAGVPCEVWRGVYTSEDGKEEGEACLAVGVGFALAELTFTNPMMHQGQTGWDQFQQYRQLVGGNKGILKVNKIEGGKTVPQLEATKIERKTVGDDAFKPPAGYTEIKMGDMMMQAQNAVKQMQEKMQQKDKGQGEP